MEMLELFQKSFPDLLKGLELTMFITIIGMFIGFFIGGILGFFSISRNKALTTISRWLVDIVRGTPIIVQSFFIFFGLPSIMNFKINAVVAGIATISINSGAYMSEIFRGGIMSIDKGQMEAARSLGVPYKNSMLKIIFPQAIKVMIPSFVNQFIISLKDTSILSVIGIQELTQSGEIIIASTFKAFQIWTMVAIMYFIVIKILSIASRKLERCLKI